MLGKYVVYVRENFASAEEEGNQKIDGDTELAIAPVPHVSI